MLLDILHALQQQNSCFDSLRHRHCNLIELATSPSDPFIIWPTTIATTSVAPVPIPVGAVSPASESAIDEPTKRPADAVRLIEFDSEIASLGVWGSGVSLFSLLLPAPILHIVNKHPMTR
jgi:hypothetical protein